ncbi:MAG: MFS transporter [Chloroflexota bacterium]|nr:MFS transporter [Chloroflexota bacterium]
MTVSTKRSSVFKGITRNVAALALVSLLTDVSSEMLVYLVPLYLANVLLAGPAIIGLIEGIAESAAAAVKLVSGALSDRLGRRKLLVGIGYGSSTLAKALFVVATSWPLVLLARLGDRLGKGIRTAPRDALIADSTDAPYRGRAFGFHRAMDTLGAFFGVIAALVIVIVAAGGERQLDAPTFQLIALIALIPAALAVGVIFIGVRDVRRAPKATTVESAPAGSRWQRLMATARQLPRPFWLFVAANTLFALGNSSDAFLALRTQQLGAVLTDLLLMIVAMNLVDTLISFPAGALSDRFGRRAPLVIAWLVYAAAYAGFALAASPIAAAGLWILYGAYYGINEAVGRAFIADVTPANLRATGYGILNAAIAVAVLPASVVAGLLWDAYGPPIPFWIGAAFALAAVVVLLLIRTHSNGARPATMATA